MDAVTPPEVEAITDAWVLSYFGDRTCADIAVVAGRPDVVRTATPTIRRVVKSPAELGQIDLNGVAGPDALDVRAVDEDGTPLAQRCVPLSETTESGRFRLFQLAPIGAKLEVLDPVALLAGTTRRDARVKVVGADDEPLANILVSPGLAFPLALTDATGVATIPTPTTTPPLDVALRFEAYGVPGAPEAGRAIVLAPASCPEVSSSLPLDTGSLALSDLAAADDVVVVLRPERTRDYLVEVFRGTSRRASLERIATATTAASGPLAIARDPRDDSYTIAIGAPGAGIEILRFDPARRVLSRGPALSAQAHANGPVPRLDVLALVALTSTGGPDLIAAAAELQPRALLAPDAGAPGAFAPFRPLLPSDDVAPQAIAAADLVDDAAVDLAIAGAEDVAIYAGLGRRTFRGRTTDRVASGVSGEMAAGSLAAGRPALVVVDPAGAASAIVLEVEDGALVERDREPVPRGVERPFLADANGDGRTDVVAFGRSPGDHVVLLGDGRGTLAGAPACEDLPDVGRPHAVDLDRDGRAEWVGLLRDARELAVIELPE